MKAKTNRNYNKLPSQTQNEQKLTWLGLITPMSFQGQNTICSLVIFFFFNVSTFITLINQKIIKILKNKYEHMYMICIFSVNCKLCSGLEKTPGYLLVLICGSFMLGRLFYSNFAQFWFNRVLNFSSKKRICGKRFFN